MLIDQLSLVSPQGEPVKRYAHLLQCRHFAAKAVWLGWGYQLSK